MNKNKALHACLLATVAASCCIMSSCHHEKAKEATPSGYVDEDTTEITLEEAGGDTLLVGSTAYYEAAKNLEVLERRMQAVNSPDMLLNTITEYDKLISEAKDLNRQVTDPKETARLDSLMHNIQVLFEQAREKNTLPAVSVIETLHFVKGRLNECASRAELCRIIDARYSFFKNIQSLHKIIENPQKANEVHRLSKEVENLLVAKKQKYGVK